MARNLATLCHGLLLHHHNSNGNSTRSSSTVLLDDDDDNAENSDYFQFLPFAGCMEEEDLADVVPKICETITTGLPKAKSKALMQLARLCDRDHQHNRIPWFVDRNLGMS
ncbi:expressed unknown protein [Seminavis robusta]|uniref:Uncharacterized protein n=1 Tax=Seminavis robusta TaxID=568900 RepID=A0A9N8HZF3_9STRA|nr:expressed unknown protein [Seminavis robusta]|eukprot:Sro2256_g321080.1 n/a (110) ;mRNA; r:14354-14683